MENAAEALKLAGFAICCSLINSNGNNNASKENIGRCSLIFR